MIKFVYFDVGGVLLDWSAVFEDATTRFNLNPEDIGKVFDENHDDITKGIMSADDLWNKCIQKYNLKNAKDFNFLESWISDYQPIREMHQLINKLESKYKIGLLSNIYEGMLPLLLEKRIIPNIHYNQIIFSCEVRMMKPNTDIYDLAHKKAEVDANEILLVDDRKDYLEEAEKLGWQTFLYDRVNLEDSYKRLLKILV